MKSKPLVSIIMPVFNGELYLKQAIGSVLSQTYSNWELLIVDDGSNDASYEIASVYSKRNSRIQLLSHPGRVNKGVSATRNVALKNCRGEYIATLDCDDEWLPEKLEKQISVIHRHPQTTLVYSLAETIDENGEVVNKKLNKRTNMIAPVTAGSGLPGGPYPIFELIVRGKIWVPSPTALAFTDTVRECKGFDESLQFQVEDHLLFSRLAEKGSVYFLNEVLARYRVHSKNWTAELDQKKRSRAYMQYCDRLIKNVKNSNIPLVSREYVDKWIKLAAQGGLKYVIANMNQILLAQLQILLHHRVRTRDKLRCLWAPLGILIRKISFILKSKLVHPFLFLYYKSGAKKMQKANHSKVTVFQPIKKSLEFIKDMNLQQLGEFGYTKTRKIPTLYASIYALLTRHLCGDLNQLTRKEKIYWTNYILSFQGEDGLFRDPAIKNMNAEMGDSWGWRHLSVHAIAALTALECRSKYPFLFTEFLLEPGNTRKWLLSLNWINNAAHTSNTVMNYGVFLQYNRDFWKINEADNALTEMFDFLDEIQNPENGLWGGPFPIDKNELSLMQQTAYHLWMLYFYDKRPVNYIKEAIDSCLELQNQTGGFGPGHHLKTNPNPFTSACEDIDCIDPLCRFYFLIDYRRNDIQVVLKKALLWVLSNQNKDGGFVFRRKESLFYGHKHMFSKKGQSNMFSTWFRTLSLGYLAKVFPEDKFFKEETFNFLECPGYQFWKSQD